MASAIAPIRRMPRPPCATVRRSAPPGSAPRPSPCFEQATIAHSGNKALLAGYGRALADNGNFQRAFDVLSRAHSPDNPDWRILSVQGTALDQLGRHDEARRYYASACRSCPTSRRCCPISACPTFCRRICRKPKRPSAAPTRSARADARVRQNLGLVVGLQGRFAEAETIVQGRSAGGGSGGQCRLSEADAEPQGQSARRRSLGAGGGSQPAGLMHPGSTAKWSSPRKRGDQQSPVLLGARSSRPMTVLDGAATSHSSSTRRINSLHRRDLDAGRPQDDDEQHRQEEQDHRHRQLRRQRGGLLLGLRSCACRGFPAPSRAASGRAACRSARPACSARQTDFTPSRPVRLARFS